jgi:DNA-binding NarL/FixJ family response regulator
MNCTNCAFAPKIKEAEHGGIRYEDTPCASCKLTEDSSRTLEYVEGQAAGPMRWPPPEEANIADQLPLSVLAEAMRGFLELPPRTFRILQRRRNGDSYALIAQELEVTPQAVEVQLRRALEAHPHLKNLLPEKARRQAARKRKRLSMARRGKMGSL